MKFQQEIKRSELCGASMFLFHACKNVNGTQTSRDIKFGHSKLIITSRNTIQVKDIQ